MSKYTLHGRFWDKIPVKSYTIQSINTDNVSMYNEGYNLFDYLRPYTRQINVSTLLNTNNDLFYNNIINYLKPCDCVFVKLDYYPKEHNPIALEFYNKRLAQINYLLSHNLKRHCKVVFTKG